MEIAEKDMAYIFGIQRLENAFKLIDSMYPRLTNIEFVNCNKEGFYECKNYILNGVHGIWEFQIVQIQEEIIRLKYQNVLIDVAFNIKGAY